MLSAPRRWIRKFPVSFITSSTKRWLYARRLWVLLILLLVCVAIHTFVTQPARAVRLMGLLRLTSSVNKQNLFPTLQNIVVGLHSESPLAAKQHQRSTQTGRGAAPHQNEEESSDDALLEKISLAAGSQVEAGKVSSGKFFLPEPETPQSPSHGLNAGIDTPSSRLSEARRVHTKASCSPKSHIVFLKTHKTASSSILNILYRYGESRNLTFALPVSKRSQLFYPLFFAARFVEGVSSGSVRDFHIMCNHMRFKKSEVTKVMPRDTFYFSILRHPVAMMESIFVYYKSIPAFRKTHSLDDFLDNIRRNYYSSVSNNHYAHNVLAFDFGLDNNMADGDEDLDERARSAIAAIEQDFHLVLISDYFEESIILLKHALCWSLEDVVSFRLNSRSQQARHQLSPETAGKITRWNALDWRIYLHFNSSFWSRVDSVVGREEMKQEVSELRRLQAELANTCLKDGGAVHPSRVKDSGLKPFQYGAAVIQGYNLNPDLDTQTRTKCQRFITPELQYTNHLYTQQFPELAAKLTQKPKKVT